MTVKETNEFEDVPGNWFTVDFHVHTPSSNDFKGDDSGETENNFRWFLKKISQSNLDIVVITDHNTIDGYKYLMKLYDDNINEKNTFEKYQHSIPPDVNEILRSFDNTFFLPGVELNIYPNLHIIIIFDPEIGIPKMEEFLLKFANQNQEQVSENTTLITQWTIDNVYNETEKINAIVVGAHVDSDHGLYNCTKDWGEGRISAFTNDKLHAMEFNNVETRDKIISLLRNPKYKRKFPISFVQSSDFHGKETDELGSKKTYVQLDKKYVYTKEFFFEFIKALRNPDEQISAPNHPKLNQILEKLKKSPSILNLNSKESQLNFVKHVCSIANTEESTITIGKTDKNNWVGITCDNLTNLKTSLTSLIANSITPIPDYKINIYQYGSKKVIVSIRILRNSKIYSLTDDDRVYKLVGNKPKKISTTEIIQLCENNFINKYSHLIITKEVSSIANSLSGITDSLDAIPLISKIDSSSIPLGKLFSKKAFGGSFLHPDIMGIPYHDNGINAGNIVILVQEKPRLEESYLRISPPNFLAEKQIVEKYNEYIFQGEKIIIVPGGGTYFNNSNDLPIICSIFRPIILQEIEKKYDFKFVIGYLKSSLAIWYAIRCLGDSDIYRNLNLAKLSIPINIDKSAQIEISSIVTEINNLESAFLIEWEKLDKSEEGIEDPKILEKIDDQIFDLRISHNSKANKLILKIDDILYAALSITINEKIMIRKALQANRIPNLKP